MSRWLTIIPGALGAILALRGIAATHEECMQLLDAYDVMLREAREHPTPDPNEKAAA